MSEITERAVRAITNYLVPALERGARIGAAGEIRDGLPGTWISVNIPPGMTPGAFENFQKVIQQVGGYKLHLTYSDRYMSDQLLFIVEAPGDDTLREVISQLSEMRKNPAQAAQSINQLQSALRQSSMTTGGVRQSNAQQNNSSHLDWMEQKLTGLVENSQQALRAAGLDLNRDGVVTQHELGTTMVQRNRSDYDLLAADQDRSGNLTPTEIQRIFAPQQGESGYRK